MSEKPNKEGHVISKCSIQKVQEIRLKLRSKDLFINDPLKENCNAKTT